MTFSTGLTLQAEGLMADHWFFIRSGKVQLTDDQGKPTDCLGPGSSFGERGLLGHGRLPVVQSREDTVVLALRREEFIRPFTGLAPSLIQTLSPTIEKALRPIEWLAQRGSNDCGVASLAMALRGHGIEANIEQVRSRTPLQQEGASLLSLIASASSFGMRGLAVRIAIDQLAGARLPAVAHYANGHYVALFEVRPDAIVIGDPASGVQTMSLTNFQSRWSGNLLVLNPAKPTRGA